MGSQGVPVEAGPAVLTLAAPGVVQAVAHAPAALARLPPSRPIEAAAVGVAIALALWSTGGKENTEQEVKHGSGSETRIRK